MGIVGAVLMVLGSMVGSAQKIHDEQKAQVEGMTSAYTEEAFLAAKGKYEADLVQLETIAENFGGPPTKVHSLEHKFYIQEMGHHDEAAKHIATMQDQKGLTFNPQEVWDINRAGGLNKVTIVGSSYEPK